LPLELFDKVLLPVFDENQQEETHHQIKHIEEHLEFEVHFELAFVVAEEDCTQGVGEVSDQAGRHLSPQVHVEQTHPEVLEELVEGQRPEEHEQLHTLLLGDDAVQLEEPVLLLQLALRILTQQALA